MGPPAFSDARAHRPVATLRAETNPPTMEQLQRMKLERAEAALRKVRLQVETARAAGS